MSEYTLTQFLNGEDGSCFGHQFVQEAECINILLVGRSQSGKSTIVQTLIDPQKGTRSSGFSDTRDPKCNNLIMVDKKRNKLYQINIIDTPGLKEVANKDESRRDEELLILASKCVKESITSLNLVCFVSRAGATQQLDIEPFLKVREFLGEDFSQISMLALTFCDEYNDNKLREFQDNIRSHETSKQYAEYCQLGIVNFGAIDLDKLEAFEGDDYISVRQSKLVKIGNMRNNFLDKIIEFSQNKMPIRQLQIIDEKAKLLIEKEIKLMGQKMKEQDRSCVIQ